MGTQHKKSPHQVEWEITRNNTEAKSNPIAKHLDMRGMVVLPLVERGQRRQNNPAFTRAAALQNRRSISHRRSMPLLSTASSLRKNQEDTSLSGERERKATRPNGEMPAGTNEPKKQTGQTGQKEPQGPVLHESWGRSQPWKSEGERGVEITR